MHHVQHEVQYALQESKTDWSTGRSERRTIKSPVIYV